MNVTDAFFSLQLNKLNQMSIGQQVPILPPTAYLPGNRFDSYKMSRIPPNPDMGGFDINGSYNQYASMYCELFEFLCHFPEFFRMLV